MGRLLPGTEAPDFMLYDDRQQLFHLAEHRGRKVLLLFLPGAFTPVCTNELIAINNDLDRYHRQDTEVAAISTDSPFVLAEFRKAYYFDMRLLSDHNAEVSARYGAKYDHDFTEMGLDRISKRASFVIDREGTIRYAEVMDDAGKMPDFHAIIRALDAIP